MRYGAKGWEFCADHAAQRWAVVLKGEVLNRYPSKRQATDMLGANLLRRQAPPRNYKLGSPMPKKES